MLNSLSWFVGLRYVSARSHKYFVSFITWVSLLCVCLGVTALIVILSVMNGLDVVERIRADKRFDDIAIVFLTSMDVVGDETLFTDLSVQAHLMKPARARLLRSTLFDVVRDVRLKRSRQVRLMSFVRDLAGPQH